MEIGEESQGLWRQIIVNKYRVHNKGWLLPMLQGKISGIWKSVLLEMTEFDNCIQYGLSNGQKINFWNEIWCGYSTLKNLFPQVFMVVRDNDAFISNHFYILGERVV